MKDSLEGLHTLENLFLCKMLRGLASGRTDGDANLYMCIIMIKNDNDITVAAQGIEINKSIL
jgi:hypothetical protein